MQDDFADSRPFRSEFDEHNSESGNRRFRRCQENDLGQAVYNVIHHTFDACSFLFNIGATVQKGTTLEDLQRIILRDLVLYDTEVSSVDARKVLMRDRLQGVRDLVILDDVNDMWKLHAVDRDWFGPVVDSTLLPETSIFSILLRSIQFMK
ncbi:hypothetical protein SUGI_1184170 [Cryptomeria japonica]|nr:hypothetical protein SUGI_1184170 [Cryptomeria japonica]